MKIVVSAGMLMVFMALYGCGGGGTTPNALTTVSAPTMSGKSTTTITVTPGTITDADGVRNVVVALYAGDRTTRIITAADGNFTGLTSGKAYSCRVEGEAKNGTTGAWEPKTSDWTDVTTDAAPEVVDSPTTITLPTLGSRTSTTINMVPGAFADDDGVQNVVVTIYDSNLKAQGTAENGQFTGLVPGSLYSLRMEGQARNNTSGVFENKVSEWNDVSTLD